MDFSILQHAWPALIQLVTGPHLLYLLVGVGIGMVVGILPGIGGLSGMAMVLPFIFGMEPGPALAMMVGLTSVTATSDTFSSVLIGVPGGAGTAATVLDGFPMTQRGEGARALSAAFAASLVGGLIGAFVLTFAFVAARPILLAVGFGEQLMLVVLSLTLVGMLTGKNVAKGLASCALGLLLGTIGSSQATAEYRFTFDTIYLSDGLPLVIVALGAFALPEVIDVMRQHYAIAQKDLVGRGWITGIRDVVRHFGLVVRCSALGALTGILPGLGGGVVGWISYGHTVQTARDRSQFGKGDVRGVIGPESANNAKDGADLIPTLFFGIPGSGTMALFLGGLVVIGVTPGRSLVTNQTDLIYLIIWSLAVANVLATGISMALARPIASLTAIRFTLIAPFVIVMIFMSAYQAKSDWGDIVALFAVGVAGIYMKRFGWSRAALLIGLVLSQRLEASLYRTVQIYGLDIFLRPIAIAILVLAVVSIGFAIRTKVRTSADDGEVSDASRRRIAPQVAFTGALLAFVIAMAADAATLKFLAKVFPLSVAAIAASLLLFVLAGMVRRSLSPGLLFDADAEIAAQNPDARSTVALVALLAGLPALTALVGFFVAAPLYTFLFLRRMGEARLPVALAGTLGLVVFLTLIHLVFQAEFADGFLQDYVELPPPSGDPGMTLLLTNDDLAPLIAAADFVGALDRAYRAFASGLGICPPRIDVQSAPGEGGHAYQLGLAAGMSGGYAALRIKSDIVFREVVEGRERKSKYCVAPGTYLGLVLVFDRTNGALLAILHDGLLQTMRVGADSALGASYLARDDSETLGVLGSGGMARAHVAAIRTVRPIRRVIVFSPTVAHREAFAREVRAEHGVDARAVADPAEVYAADIVSSCASAVGPIVEGRLLRPGTHLTCIGGALDAEANGRVDVALRFGLAPAPAEAPALGVEDECLTFAEAGPKASGGGARRYAEIPPEREVSFAELLADPARGRRSADQITFSQRGNIHGLQFAAVAGLLVERARAANLGRVLPDDLFLQSIRN